MARTVDAAFDILVDRLIPTPGEQSAASQHRGTVLDALQAGLVVKEFFQSGSFSHGTGVAGYSDFDYFAVLGYQQPASPDTALEWVRTPLAARFPYSGVHVDRPAVVIPFAKGAETYEVIPAFGSAVSGYTIPGPSGGWVTSNPRVHLAYVNTQNDRLNKKVKPLARLLKAWAYYNDVPISSFYLEMRAAKYAVGESAVVYDIDVQRLLVAMSEDDLASIWDPTGVAGFIEASSSALGLLQARAAVTKAAVSALKATINRTTNPAAAFLYWDEVFAEKFPAYY